MTVRGDGPLGPTGLLDDGLELLSRELLVERVVDLGCHSTGRHDLDDSCILPEVGSYRLRHFGYAIAHYADFYDIGTLIIMGRATSGPGGQILIDAAEEVLKKEFPELAKKINITQPDEKMKRHGQAVAAASLPSISKA